MHPAHPVLGAPSPSSALHKIKSLENPDPAPCLQKQGQSSRFAPCGFFTTSGSALMSNDSRRKNRRSHSRDLPPKSCSAVLATGILHLNGKSRLSTRRDCLACT